MTQSNAKLNKEYFNHSCGVCHGDSATSGGVLPDLRYSASLADPQIWNNIVREGALEGHGMVSFASEYSSDQTDAIRAYVIHRANQDAAKLRQKSQKLGAAQ